MRDRFDGKNYSMSFDDKGAAYHAITSVIGGFYIIRRVNGKKDEQQE